MDAPDRVVVADFEAGTGTLTRTEPGALDAVLIVVEPTQRSMEVGERARSLAHDLGIPRIVIVANRLRDAADRASVRGRFVGLEVVEVPDDPAIAEADREGVAPLDRSPHSPAVLALTDLAAGLAVTPA